MSRVESETERMTHLVEDMLLLARLDTGQTAASASRSTVAAWSSTPSATPTSRGPTTIGRSTCPTNRSWSIGDEARLHQVLANLLANARTHTPAGTSVTTRWPSTAITAVLTVADDGPGIPAGLQPEVFERFARGDSSRSRRERQYRPRPGDRRRGGQGAQRHDRRAQRARQDRIRGDAARRIHSQATATPNPAPSRVADDRVGDCRSPCPARRRRADATSSHDAPCSATSPSARGWRSASCWSAPPLLYLWNLSASGWANGFYSAAAQAGADNWTAMLFGSSDAAQRHHRRQDSRRAVGDGRLGAACSG